MCKYTHMHLIIQNRYILGEDLKDIINMNFLVKLCGFREISVKPYYSAVL